MYTWNCTYILVNKLLLVIEEMIETAFPVGIPCSTHKSRIVGICIKFDFENEDSWVKTVKKGSNETIQNKRTSNTICSFFLLIGVMSFLRALHHYIPEWVVYSMLETCLLLSQLISVEIPGLSGHYMDGCTKWIFYLQSLLLHYAVCEIIITMAALDIYFEYTILITGAVLLAVFRW